MDYTDKLKKNRVIIAIMVIAVIIVVVVYLVGKKAGVNATAPAIPGDNPNNPLTEAERIKINSITDALIADIYSWSNAAFRNWNVYQDLATSSDRVFVGVWNLYKSKKNVSLKTDMQGESYWIDQNPLSETDIIQLIFNRFNSLNLN
jgi:hypothetical protein